MVLSIIVVASYILLLVLALAFHWGRGGQPALRWMAAYQAASVLLVGTYAAGPILGTPIPGIVTALLHLLCLSLLGAVTFEYIEHPGAWVWPASGGLAMLALVAGGMLEPMPGMFGQAWLPALTGSPPSPVAVAAIGLWLLGLWTQLGFVVASLQQARLPLHANRRLFWGLAIPVVLGGEALAVWGQGLSPAVAQVVRLAGVVGLSYALIATRLFDVRNFARHVVMQVLLLIVTTVFLLLAIQLASVAGSTGWALGLIPVALGVGLVYQIVRGLAEPAIRQLVLNTGYDTSRSTREFSERVANLLDVPELARAVAGTFGTMFGARHVILLLLTTQKDGWVTLQPVPVKGREPVPPTTFAANNPVVGALQRQREPLLQYDVDVDPAYRSLAAAERDWLRNLGVDVYLPVRDGADTLAVFAVGPRASGDPYRAEELGLLAALVDQSATVLKNSRLFMDLKALNDSNETLNRSLQSTNEALGRMSEVKSDFITIASHELRTPLAQLRGYAELLGAAVGQGSLQPEAVRDIVDSIQLAADRMDHVYTQMLDVSQLDVDAVELRLDDTSMDVVLRSAAEPYLAAMRERKLSLTVQGLRQLPSVRADAPRLVQAFGHLIGNAVKYTPDGGRIEIAARVVNANGGSPSVEVVVADSGIGIEPRYHELIFEKFFRTGNVIQHSTGATKFMGAGPGLGLPLAKGIIERHGGRIWVESSGQDLKALPGSRFHVVLPVNPPPFMQAAATPATVRQPTG